MGELCTKLMRDGFSKNFFSLFFSFFPFSFGKIFKLLSHVVAIRMHFRYNYISQEERAGRRSRRRAQNSQKWGERKKERKREREASLHFLPSSFHQQQRKGGEEGVSSIGVTTVYHSAVWVSPNDIFEAFNVPV